MPKQRFVNNAFANDPDGLLDPPRNSSKSSGASGRMASPSFIGFVLYMDSDTRIRNCEAERWASPVTVHEIELLHMVACLTFWGI